MSVARRGIRREVRAVCVYTGSSYGADPQFAASAAAFGALLAERRLDLVYGGANVGLMGILADAALGAGGRVIGLVPEALQAKELAHQGLTELHIVGSMHERKLAMMERADAFVALPGGSGTLDELFETFTWLQLGLHTKPIGLLDVNGYWNHLLAFLDHAVEQQLLRRDHADMLLVASGAGSLLDAFERWEPPATPKWIDRSSA
jgi:uncharacterized protein (TIGR00730 family)